jgi:hypothetical protein
VTVLAMRETALVDASFPTGASSELQGAPMPWSVRRYGQSLCKGSVVAV